MNEHQQIVRIINDLEGVSPPQGYTALSHCPEVYTAVDKIADPISNMTLYLMENTDHGDVRVQNGLSRLVDIAPSKYMTSKQWMKALVRCLLLEGDGNAVVKPVYKDDLIEELLIVPPGEFSINPGKDFEDGYTIQIKNKKYDPADLVHFVLNPSPTNPYVGESYRYQLRDLTDGLADARALEAKFMEGRYMPSLIVKVRADEELIMTHEGRDSMISKFMESDEQGAPWFIPEDILDVEQITPLSLKDIAISDSVSNYKKTIAGLLGVPAFLLGEGEFDRDEYNTFIKDRVCSVARVIEQTLTKQLLVNPKWYFKFNLRSLYSYDFDTMVNAGDTLYSHGLITGNEARNWVDLTPMDGLDELVILENYIPQSSIGDQKKLEDSNEADVQPPESDEG